MRANAMCHPDAKRYVTATGECMACYNRRWRAANPDRLKDHKRREYAKHREKYIAHGRAYYAANAPAIIAKAKAWAAAHPERKRQGDLRRNYGLTVDDYRDMLVGQAGRCLVCLRVPERDLVIDHDHATGKVRGLLCHHCNRALGHLRDDPRVALSAARYLEVAV